MYINQKSSLLQPPTIQKHPLRAYRLGISYSPQLRESLPLPRAYSRRETKLRQIDATGKETTKWQALDKHKDTNKYWLCIGAKRSASYHILQKRTLFPQTESRHCPGLPGHCRDQKSPRKVGVTSVYQVGKVGTLGKQGFRASGVRGGRPGIFFPLERWHLLREGLELSLCKVPLVPRFSLPKAFLHLIVCRGGQVHCPHFPVAVA